LADDGTHRPADAPVAADAPVHIAGPAGAFAPPEYVAPDLGKALDFSKLDRSRAAALPTRSTRSDVAVHDGLLANHFMPFLPITNKSLPLSSTHKQSLPIFMQDSQSWISQTMQHQTAGGVRQQSQSRAAWRSSRSLATEDAFDTAPSGCCTRAIGAGESGRMRGMRAGHARATIFEPELAF
jgi:hypothetical protein